MDDEPVDERQAAKVHAHLGSCRKMQRVLGGANSERARAGLEVTCELGRKGSRRAKMTGSKTKSAKQLLAHGAPARAWTVT